MVGWSDTPTLQSINRLVGHCGILYHHATRIWLNLQNQIFIFRFQFVFVHPTEAPKAACRIFFSWLQLNIMRCGATSRPRTTLTIKCHGDGYNGKGLCGWYNFEVLVVVGFVVIKEPDAVRFLTFIRGNQATVNGLQNLASCQIFNVEGYFGWIAKIRSFWGRKFGVYWSNAMRLNFVNTVTDKLIQ